MIRVVAALLVLLAAGCGGTGDDGGSAQLWVTRDRGETVLYEETVPAGLTVMQALERVAEVDTRYGGRFVQAIDGIEGSVERGRDWFYFVNGVAADRGAAEYRLRDGEIAWWDYRRWSGEQPPVVVVGAFPEPFRHGYGGSGMDVVVAFASNHLADEAQAIARVIGPHAVVERRTGPVPPRARPKGLLVVGEGPGMVAEAPSSQGPYTVRMSAEVARALILDPARYRFRYEVTG